MPLANSHDDALATRMRAEQTDPLVMYLVVRREQLASFLDLAEAVAKAVVRCAARYRPDPLWSARFAAWDAASYRKVTLRARESDWARLLREYPLVTGEGSTPGVPLVAALPPRHKSERPKFLMGLQTYNLALEALPAGQRASGGAETMRLSLNPTLQMSSGKALAQLGHGALMAFDRLSPALQAAWLQRGAPTALQALDAAAWQRLRARPDTSLVRDNGLTELAPGAETVLALPPQLPER